MKLNVGCGYSKKFREGYVTIDSDPGTKPDHCIDIEWAKFPLENDICEEIILHHILEHVGMSASSYARIWKEIYRIAKHNCKLSIIVPHHNSCNFVNDPTHIRAITIHQLHCLSKDFIDSEKHEDGTYKFTPFSHIWDVDFTVGEPIWVFDDYWKEQFESGQIDAKQLNLAANTYFNVVHEMHVEMRAVKNG